MNGISGNAINRNKRQKKISETIINSALTCEIKQDLKILELKLYTYITLHN